MKDKLAVQSEMRGEQVRLASGIHGIVIDFAAVKRIDSSGVGIVVSIMWSASKAGGKLVVAALPERIKEVLSIAMLLDHIDNADTVQEALAKLDAA
jgi:anti-anti-sigma factor